MSNQVKVTYQYSKDTLEFLETMKIQIDNKILYLTKQEASQIADYLYYTSCEINSSVRKLKEIVRSYELYLFGESDINE